MSKRSIVIRRTDGNQVELVDAARRIGASVQPIHIIGQGCPDLLIGYRGRNFVVEVKDYHQPRGKRQLSPDEKVWHAKWNGQVATVETIDDLYNLLKAVV